MQPRRITRFLPPLIALSALLVFSPGVSYGQTTSAASASAPMSADLQAARAALAKYNDPFAAIRDGYFSTLACIDFPQGAKHGPVEYPPGAMGVHFLNPANIGPKLDPTRPQVLIYEPVGDKLTLVAAEWFMPVAAAGTTVPAIFGRNLEGPMDGHQPIMPEDLRHYDLHVWLWKDNPRGVFTSTNAAVKCDPKATYTIAVPGHH